MNKRDTEKVTTRKIIPLRRSDQAAAMYPYSAIPRDYFTKMRVDVAEGGGRTLLSIQSWDGREVLAVNTK